MKDFEELLKHIGKPYQAYNKDGSVQGCAFPLQFLYGMRPDYYLDKKDISYTRKFALRAMRKYCKQISVNDLKKGDIIVTKIKHEVHFAVYYEYGKVVHTFKNNDLQIGHLDSFRNYFCFRVME